MTELEREILNKIITLEFENKDRLYKGGSHHKSKVRDDIKEVISQYAPRYINKETNNDNK